MFKNLRDRLKGVSQKLEDELEAELEDQLERELAEEMARGQAPAPAADEAGAAPQEGGEQDAPPSETQDETDVETAPEEAPAEVQEAPDEPSPVPEEKPDQEPAQRVGGPEAEPDEPATAVPQTEQEEESATAARETEQEEAPAPETARPSGTPTEAPASAAQAPTGQEAQEQKEPAKPKPVTGRKQLTAEEIEARLRSELEEAVEVQREVEEVVRESGAKVSRYTINEEVLEDILWELEVGLLESDVALPVIEAIKENVKEQLLSMSVAGKSADQVVEKVLRTAIRRVLNVGRIDFDAWVRERLDAGKKPVVVMFVGVNGTGKTTSIARIAHRLKEQGISSVMAAGDTFRAGAIEQLVTHGDRLGIRVVKHSAKADPAAVAYDAIEHAKARHKDVVLLDTAGRMQTNTNLMDEMDKIRRVANPDLVVFVGDSLAGNDAVEQARRFDEVVDINGAILTKVDVDAKGGAALSVAYTVNKPLLFVGVGQDYDDLRPFDADWMVDRLFGSEAD